MLSTPLSVFLCQPNAVRLRQYSRHTFKTCATRIGQLRDLLQHKNPACGDRGTVPDSRCVPLPSPFTAGDAWNRLRGSHAGWREEQRAMPIYEFYCPDCNVLFNFFSRKINTTGRPPCPKCRGKRMQREVSLFAATGSAAEPGADGGGDLPFDESRMEKAMGALAGEAEGLDENDPRQAASLMRKLTESTGMRLGKGMEEAMGRLEAGEDPEKIESEMGDMLDGDGGEPFIMPGAAAGSASKEPRQAPRRDKTLYEM